MSIRRVTVVQLTTLCFSLCISTQAVSEDWAAVERESRQCVQEQPNSTNCVVRHADAMAHLGQPYDGILQLDSFIGAHPSAIPAVLLYAQLLQNVAQDANAAEAALRKTAQLAPNDARVWQALGALYAGQHKASEAVDCYGKALQINPNDPLLLAGLAYSRYLNGDASGAETEFKRAFALNTQRRPPLVGVPVLYGAFLRDSGHAAESIPHFTRALELNAQLWQVYYERASAYERSGDLEKAEKDALTALQGEGDRRDIRLLLLSIYRKKGDSAGVAEQSAAIEKLNRSEDQYYATAREMRESLGQAEAAVTKGDCRGAIPPYERVVRLMPTFYEAWFPLGVCYSETGNRAKAESALQTYLRYQPLSADGHSALGLVLVGLGKTQEARAELQKAVEIDGGEVEAAAALARIEYADKRYAEAAKLARQALSDSNAAAGTYAVAAESEAALGDRESALRFVNAGLEKWPDDEPLQNIDAALLSSCLYSKACKEELLRAVERHPASLAYRKAAVRAMVMANVWDPDTGRSVSQLVSAVPQDGEAWLIQAIFEERRNHLKNAAAAAKQAMTVAPDNSSVRVAAANVVAQCCEGSGDMDCAGSVWEQAWKMDLKLGVPDPGTGVAWAEFLGKRGDGKRAVSVLDEVTHYAPGFASGYIARARELARIGEKRQAIEDATAALRITDDPNLLGEAHALLAKLYAAAGQAELAEQHQRWVEAHSELHR